MDATEKAESAVRDHLEALGVTCEHLPCDPAMADTAEFCRHYDIAPEDSANAIIVASKRPKGVLACCLVLASDRLDVNRKVCAELEIKRASFADAEQTLALTGQMIGGVTVFGLPEGLPVLVDENVMKREQVVIGGGSRSLKLRLAPAELRKLPSVRVACLHR